MKGFRVPAQGSKKDQLKSLENEMKNQATAGRIGQMMTQQLMQSVKAMSDDLGSALNQLYELQYSFNAVKKHLNLDSKVLEEIANAQRLVDFNEASARQDTKDNLLEGAEVMIDSTVTITSTAKDEAGNDRGIFRSRLKLSESGVPDLINALAGKKVGDKVQVKLNGVDHEVELLSIRNPNLAQTEVTAEATH